MKLPINDLSDALILYMRETVKQYVLVYNLIAPIVKRLEEMQEGEEWTDEDEPEFQEYMDLNAELNVLTLSMHNTLQPILTMYEDTLPENIQNTLEGRSPSKMNMIAVSDDTLN